MYKTIHNRTLGFAVITLMIMGSLLGVNILPAHASVYGGSSTAYFEPVIEVDDIRLADSGLEYKFEINVRGIASENPVNLAIASYDANGVTVNKTIVQATVGESDIYTLPYDVKDRTYKIMALDGESLLKPICASKSGKFDFGFAGRSPVAIATRVSSVLNSDGDEVVKVEYLRDGVEDSIIIDDSSTNVGWSANDEIRFGDAFVFIENNGIAEEYVVIANVKSYSKYDIFDINSLPEGAGSDTQIYSGYISSEPLGEDSVGKLAVMTDTAEHVFNIDDNANIYVYDNDKLYPTIETANELISGTIDYYDETSGIATPVFVKTYKGTAVDVYAMSQKIDLNTNTCVSPTLEPVVRTEESISISSNDILNISSDGLTYKYSTNNGTEYLTVDRDVVLFRNTKMIFDGLNLSPRALIEKLRYQNRSDNAFLTFTDSDSNGYYDMVEAMVYESGIVNEVLIEDEILKVKFGIDIYTLHFYPEDTSVTTVLTNDAGDVLNLADFSVGDAVSIASDGTDIRHHDNYIEVVRIDDAPINGIIDEVYTYMEESYVVIGDTSYRSLIEALKPGYEASLYLGIHNEVCGARVKDKTNYGYIIEATAFESDTSGKTWQIKIVSRDGLKIYTTTAEGTADFDKYPYKYITTDSSGNCIWDGRMLSKRDRGRLIAFDVDESGMISEITFVYNTNGSIDSIVEGFAYSALDKKIDIFTFTDNTLIVDVTSSDAAEAKSYDISKLEDGMVYNGMVYTNEYDECIFAVITERLPDYKPEPGIAIVTSISAYEDDEGYEAYYVKFIQNEAEGSVVINRQTVKKGDISIDDLSIGDVIFYNTADDSGVASDYAVIAKIMENESSQKEIRLTVDRDFLGGDIKLYGGYILNEYPYITNMGEKIDIGSMGKYADYEAYITRSTNQYSYVNKSDVTEIVTDDWMAEDAYYMESEAIRVDGVWKDLYTPVIIMTIDDSVIDIYTSNDRIAN